jgi:hypothetical protein
LGDNEATSFDKGYEGAKEHTCSEMPLKSKSGVKRTMEEKEKSNQLKKQRIIVKNTINAIKCFKILKNHFLYPTKGVFFPCSSITFFKFALHLPTSPYNTTHYDNHNQQLNK